jgi:hypothetical protein
MDGLKGTPYASTPAHSLGPWSGNLLHTRVSPSTIHSFRALSQVACTPLIVVVVGPSEEADLAIRARISTMVIPLELKFVRRAEGAAPLAATTCNRGPQYTIRHGKFEQSRGGRSDGEG